MSLPALLNSPIKVNKSIYNANFVVDSTIGIWKELQYHIKALRGYLDTPICETHSFVPIFFTARWSVDQTKRTMSHLPLPLLSAPNISSSQLVTYNIISVEIISDPGRP